MNPSLVRLLRRESLLDAAVPQPLHDDPPVQDDLRVRDELRVRDDLAPARGIGLSVLLGILLWAALAVGLYWLFAA